MEVLFTWYGVIIFRHWPLLDVIFRVLSLLILLTVDYDGQLLCKMDLLLCVVSAAVLL